MQTSSLDIYESLMDKMVSVGKSVADGEYSYEVGAAILAGYAIQDVACDLGVEENMVRDIFLGAMFQSSPWYPFYHSFVFPMDRTNRSLEEDPPKENGLTGYVYIMEDPNSGLFKIGKSLDPNSRLANLNRNLTPQAEPYLLRVSVRVPDYSNLEERLHERYDGVRSEPKNGQGNEWFELSDKDVDDILEYLVGLRDEYLVDPP